jgi:hypothetical protein
VNRSLSPPRSPLPLHSAACARRSVPLQTPARLEGRPLRRSARGARGRPVAGAPILRRRLPCCLVAAYALEAVILTGPPRRSGRTADCCGGLRRRRERGIFLARRRCAARRCRRRRPVQERGGPLLLTSRCPQSTARGRAHACRGPTSEPLTPPAAPSRAPPCRGLFAPLGPRSGPWGLRASLTATRHSHRSAYKEPCTDSAQPRRYPARRAAHPRPALTRVAAGAVRRLRARVAAVVLRRHSASA